MAPASFTAWRERLHFSKSDAARALGVSRNWIIKFETGDSVIPDHIALATAAIAYGLPRPE
jgi:transcriptional regulator with XRE-family HTH domain